MALAMVRPWPHWNLRERETVSEGTKGGPSRRVTGSQGPTKRGIHTPAANTALVSCGTSLTSEDQQ
ncbi:hypothetical protein E2C01_078252 [Portunus trituberculatus]|uniref:Uncharacterized protein n=1 Tax=Portunus trituberculatus TaxID=210409 RepID=A0A5B7IGH9_PORTR|nr:hypothetical protein [Portunus trituberculatus]